MPSLSHDQKERLYRQIASQIAAKGAERMNVVDKVLVELGAGLVARFPSLVEPNNKYELLLAIEMQFEKIEKAIRWDDQCEEQSGEARFYHQQSESRSIDKLISLGVLPPRSATMDDEIPF